MAYTLYWCVYPSAGASPTANEVVNQTYAGGFFGTDSAPVTTTNDFLGSQIGGLSIGTSYRTAVVADDGTTRSNIVYSDAWSTTDTYSIYWCVFPSAGALPTADEIIDQTYAGGVFGTDTAPTVTTNDFLGTVIGSISAGSYRLAAVSSNGVSQSNVVYTTAFSVGGDTITSPYFNSQSDLYSLTLDPGAATLSAPYFDSQSGWFAPDFTSVATLLVPYFASQTTFYDLDLEPGPNSYATYFDSDTSIYIPTLQGAGAVPIYPPYLESSPSFWSPTLGVATSPIGKNNKLFYKPTTPPLDQRQAIAWTMRELFRVSEVTQQDNLLQYLYVEPGKPQDGLIVLADGDVWNPGHGRGVYVYFDGQWVALGTRKTYWDDLKFPASAFNPPGQASDPDFDATNGTWLFASSGTEVVYLIAQMPHAWKEGSVIKPHVHWYKTTSAPGNVMWQLEYKKFPIGDVGDSSFTAVTASTPAVSDGDTAFQHALTSFGSIDMTGLTLSDMLIMKLSRLGSDAADTYGADAAVLEFDIHYEIDAYGSRQEYIK